ncbi:MAG: hypothetical protein NVS2B16_18080 [Chloroflexota bacterium]
MPLGLCLMSSEVCEAMEATTLLDGTVPARALDPFGWEKALGAVGGASEALRSCAWPELDRWSEQARAGSHRSRSGLEQSIGDRKSAIDNEVGSGDE